MLGPDDYSGPIRGFANCTCTQPSFAPIAGPPVYIPTVNPCAVGPGNEAVPTDQFQCSFGVRLQSTIDRARQLTHQFGLRPYRVWLVWQKRERDREFEEHFRCELMPVFVLAMDSIELNSSVWGEDMVGGVSLTWISAAQVTEDTLRGYLDGEDWAAQSTEREFFYEIQMHARCLDAKTPRRRRFIPATEPHFQATSFEWRVALNEQKVSRSRDGVDQTIGTEHEDGTSLAFKPTIVT